MKKYKIWLHIEEIDEDKNHYEDLDEHLHSIGPEFENLSDAIYLKERLIDCVADNEEARLSYSGNTVRSLKDAFRYIADCNLATVCHMAMKRSRPKYEYARQISIAEKCCEYMVRFGVDPKGTRAEDIIGKQSVRKWVEQYDVLKG